MFTFWGEEAVINRLLYGRWLLHGKHYCSILMCNLTNRTHVKPNICDVLDVFVSSMSFPVLNHCAEVALSKWQIMNTWVYWNQYLKIHYEMIHAHYRIYVKQIKSVPHSEQVQRWMDYCLGIGCLFTELFGMICRCQRFRGQWNDLHTKIARRNELIITVIWYYNRTIFYPFRPFILWVISLV